jgi:hypothetical protein
MDKDAQDTKTKQSQTEQQVANRATVEVANTSKMQGCKTHIPKVANRTINKSQIRAIKVANRTTNHIITNKGNQKISRKSKICAKICKK